MSSRWTDILPTLHGLRTAVVLLLPVVFGACAGDGGDDIGTADGGVVDFGSLPEAGPVDLGAVDAMVPTVDAAMPMECSMGSCDPMSTLACDDAGVAACRIGADGPFCGGVFGGGGESTPCTQRADCKPGLDCFATKEGGRCQRVCCGVASATGCGLFGRCSLGARLVDGSNAAGGWGRCVEPRPCDVLDPAAGCDPGEACTIVSGSGEVDCRVAGDAGVGDACATVSDCAPGLFCAGLVERTCRRICALSDAGADGCPEGEGTCRAYPYSPPGTGICSRDALRSSR